MSLAAALAIALSSAAAPPATPAGAPAPVMVPVPAAPGPQEVRVLTREFAVGGSSGWHTHPGVEIGHVIAGVTEMRSADGPPRRYGAGETFVIARGTVHNGVNAGDVPARLVITYVTDQGQPVRADAADPCTQ